MTKNKQTRETDRKNSDLNTSTLSNFSAANIETDNFLQKTMDASADLVKFAKIKELKKEVDELTVKANSVDPNYRMSAGCEDLIKFVMEKMKEDPLMCKVGENPYVEEGDCCTITWYWYTELGTG